MIVERRANSYEGAQFQASKGGNPDAHFLYSRRLSRDIRSHSAGLGRGQDEACRYAMKPMSDHMKSSDGMKPMADGSMMTMMKGGEVVAVMADGHMGTTTISDDKMMTDMMKMGKPMKGCAMFMTGADGKMMAIDTSSKAAKAECEKIAR